MKVHAIALSAVGLMLASCSTPMTPDRATAVRALPGAGDAQFVVTRDTGIFGSACTIHIAFDGKEVGKLDPGEKLTYRVVAGQHEIRANMCGGSIQYYTATIAAKQSSLISVGSGMSQPLVIRHDRDVPLT